MRRLISSLCLWALLLCLGGCSTVSGWFTSDDDDIDPREPAALEKIETQLRVDRLWSVAVGKGQGRGLYRLTPVIAGDRIYAASADGQVRAVESDGGGTLWKVDLKRPLAGGVGYYDDRLYVGGSDGEVLALDADNGEEIWQAQLSGEVLAPPQGDGSVVLVQTYDGKLYGLDYDSGERLWNFDSNVPVLTIRGTSTPILADGLVFAGFANGRVLSFDAATGAVLWEARIAIPQGRSEIERIVDVDGTMTLQGLELYVASYQGRVAALDVRTGRKLWQRNTSTFNGVSQGFGNLYVAEENGTVIAYLRNGQGIRWQQEVLAWRGLSRPAPVSSYLAVSDFQGYVHFLSQVDGEILARIRPDKDGVRADMIGVGSRIYLFTNSGKLQAYSVAALE